MDDMGLVGSSAALAELRGAIERISRYRTNVLLLGESGTGKELVARALHARGPRGGRPFVPVNCATLGREILENELFGHERGAFTGANERKTGLFEQADGGTLFLDEIGEMDPGTQAKLLRVLERNAFRRVGGTEKIQVDLGIIAATNQDLEQAITQGRFREDLYYRLKVVALRVPPLREHREDIPELAAAFIADFNRRHGGRIAALAPEALAHLKEHGWPGNVRELKNAIDSAAVLVRGDAIGPDDLPALGGAFGTRPPTSVEPTVAAPADLVQLSIGSPLADAERALILAAVQRFRTKAEAAQALGIGLRTLYTKLRAYGAG
ncbi:MAG: sigma-54 interaction domain-containing protein [Myxococcales bacterium]